MTARVREAETADVPAVIALLASDGAIPGVPDDPEALERVIANDHTWLLVADEDGAIAGTIVAGWDGWRGSLYRLAVRPEARRKGIARALVRAAEERLRGAGARRVSALVMRQSEQAAAFWQAAGYEVDARVSRYVRDLTGG